MKAIILAAGEGKRLRPLTEDTPKSMVELWGKGLLQRQLEQLALCGIDDITVITGYKKEAIEGLAVNTVYNEHYNTTNMVFSLSKALPTLNRSCEYGSVLILYGDIAYDIEHLKTLINNVSQLPVTVLGNDKWLSLWQQRMAEPLQDAETFIYDQQGKLIEIGQKPTSLKQVQAQYMGMLKVNEAFLFELLSDYVAKAQCEKVNNLYLTDLIQQVATLGKVSVCIVSGSWIEVDTLEDYQLYHDNLAGHFGL